MEDFCPNCEEYHETVFANRTETYTVQDKEVTVPVTACVCCNCGATVIDNDDEVIRAVYAKARL